MKHHNTVFHQLLKALPRHQFQKAVDRHNGDRKIRTLNCWTQLNALLFGQLTSRKSLRDLEENFNTQHAHHYHLGVKPIKRSSLSDANAVRPASIFAEVFYFLLEVTRKKLSPKIVKEMIRLIDSTTIDLNISQFEWARFRSTKAGIKLHTIYDPNAEAPVFFSMTEAKTNDRKAAQELPFLPGMTYVFDRAYNDYKLYQALTQQDTLFVGRMKTNAVYEVVESQATEAEHILEDQVIRLTSAKAQKDCPALLRRVTIRRENDNKILSFITNDLKRTAQEIADLYKARWQIELFFKWIKQNLKIKHFIGRSENAVKIQVFAAMIAYLLLRLVQIGYPGSLSLQQISRRVNLNLTSRRSLSELLNDPPPARAAEAEADQITLGLLCA